MKEFLLRIPIIRSWVTNRALSKYNSFDSGLIRIHIKYEPFTMCKEYKFLRNLSLVRRYKNVQGCIVECGTWKGGMIAGMAELLDDNNRNYFLFDSFEGLPPAKEIDGKSAIEWQNDTEAEAYLDNCYAQESDAQAAMALSKTKNWKTIKGWFQNTLPGYDFKEEIAILRLDGDWYESTIQCLNNLYPKVKTGGIIIIDDYYTWEGCTKAVHDYLSKNNISSPVMQYMDTVAFIIKK
ncbi:MAG: TylF/MycF/NovP-related O-methyltransferase [Saprospiraceae bacterium]